MKLNILFECANILYNADIDDPKQQKAISVAENYILNSYKLYKNYCINEDINPLNEEEYLYEIVNEAPVNPQAIMQMLSMYGGGYNPMMMQPRPMPMYNPYGMGMSGFGSGLIGAFAQGAMQGYQNRINPQPIQQETQPQPQKKPGVIKSFFGGMKDAFYKTPEELQQERQAAVDANMRANEIELPNLNQHIKQVATPTQTGTISALSKDGVVERYNNASDRTNKNEWLQNKLAVNKKINNAIRKTTENGKPIDNEDAAKLIAGKNRYEELRSKGHNLTKAERKEFNKLYNQYQTADDVRRKQEERALNNSRGVSPEEIDARKKEMFKWLSDNKAAGDYKMLTKDQQNNLAMMNNDERNQFLQRFRNDMKDDTKREQQVAAKSVPIMNKAIDQQNIEIQKQRNEIQKQQADRQKYLDQLKNQNDKRSQRTYQQLSTMNRDQMDKYFNAETTQDERRQMLKQQQKINRTNTAKEFGQNIASKIGTALTKGVGTALGVTGDIKNKIKDRMAGVNTEVNPINETIKIEFISLLEEYNLYDDGRDIINNMVQKDLIDFDIAVDYLAECEKVDHYDKSILLNCFSEALAVNGITTKVINEPLTPSIRVPATIQERGYRF